MSKTTIKNVYARQIIDCKCRPMVEVDVVTEGGYIGRGCAPTGSSVGIYESCVLRDGDKNEYHGLGVRQAVKNVNDIIAPALIGMDVKDQAALDERMIALDGTPNMKNLGGNAIYSTSIACYRAAAASENKELYEYIAKDGIKTVPIPSFNVINGGRYPDCIQPFNEFIIMPYKAGTIDKAVEMGVLVFQELGNVLEEYLGHKPGVGGSYGWIAPSGDPEVVLDLIEKAIDNCGFSGKVAFALDCASSEFYDKENKSYYLKGKSVSSQEMISYAKQLTEKYNFVFIEDLLDEDDWEGYEIAHKEITRTLIIGDDFIVSNPKRIKEAYERHCIDGFILKPNQVGTITEAMKCHSFAAEHNLLSITSGRSGGVVGDVVMDLAVGLQIKFIKNGCPRSGERIDKLNFLLRAASRYPGCSLADISDIVKF